MKKIYKYLFKNKGVGSFSIPLLEGKKLPKGISGSLMPKMSVVCPANVIDIEVVKKHKSIQYIPIHKRIASKKAGKSKK